MTEASPRPRRALGRYAPILLVVGLQLLLLTVAEPPEGDTLRAGSGPGGAGFASGAPSGPAGTAPGGVPGVEADPIAGVAGSAPLREEGLGGAPGDPAAVPAGGGGAGGGAQRVATATGPGAAGSPVDGLGRPLSGDTSRCAGDGRQVSITRYSPPCIPAFVGDNGGATAPGVTGDTIRIVRYRGLNGEELDAVLGTQNLAVTEAEDAEILERFETFFNRHYEFYGRKVELIQYQGQCNIIEADMACFRADAKALVKKYDPYMVLAVQLYWQIGDELARLGVPSTGTTWGKDRAWSLDRRPLFWEVVPDGDTVVEMLADYYCTKLYGRPADRAGDASLRVKTRRLGILVPEDPSMQATGRRLEALLSGGRCGTAEDGPVVYVHSNEDAKAGEQYPNIAAQMKADGVTTVTIPRSHFGYNISLTRGFDRQAYFPEHLLSGTGASDHDAVGRLSSPTQWANAFGISWLPKLVPVDQGDGYRAVKSVDPSYDYDSPIPEGTFTHLQLVATLIQSAGPRLTPETMERGIFSLPQIGGHANPQPWPGWMGGDPVLPLHRWGTYAGDYSGHKDAKEVYWSADAISEADGGRGAYVCAEGCRRRQIGEWTAAPPPGP